MSKVEYQGKEINVITATHPFNFWAINAVEVNSERIKREGDFTDFNTLAVLIGKASQKILKSPNLYDMEHKIEFILFDGEEYISHLNFDKLNKRAAPKCIRNAQLCGVESYRIKYMALFGIMAFMPYAKK